MPQHTVLFIHHHYQLGDNSRKSNIPCIFLDDLMPAFAGRNGDGDGRHTGHTHTHSDVHMFPSFDETSHESSLAAPPAGVRRSQSFLDDSPASNTTNSSDAKIGHKRRYSAYSNI